MIVKIDTREQLKWTFTHYGVEEQIGKLRAGDYSIVGYEDKIAIERKRNTGEIYTNLIKDYKRFSKELKILSDYEVKYVLCEFDLNAIYTFPANSGILKQYWPRLKCGSKMLAKMIERVYNDYNIPFIFSASPQDAQDKAYNILRDYAISRTSD